MGVRGDDSRGGVGGGAAEKDNSRFIANQRLVTQQNIEQQDINLDALGNAADRLGAMSGAINQGLRYMIWSPFYFIFIFETIFFFLFSLELKEQNLMLDQLDSDMDEAGEKMNFVLERLGKLLNTKDGCQLTIILILIVILAILGKSSHQSHFLSSPLDQIVFYLLEKLFQLSS